MAIKKKKIQMHKKYSNGDIDTLYPITRAEDVLTDDAGTTLASKITKLDNIQEGATTVAGSSTNGNIKINGTETKVYTHPNSGATAGSYNKVTVNAQGHVTAGENVTDWNGTVSGNASNATVAFTAASSRANLTTGEKLSVAFGKLAKLYNDLKSLAFVDSVGTSQLDSTLLAEYNKRVTTDKVTESTAITEAGWVADARAVAALQNSITTINSNLNNYIPKTGSVISGPIKLRSNAPYYELINPDGDHISLIKMFNTGSFQIYIADADNGNYVSGTKNYGQLILYGTDSGVDVSRRITVGWGDSGNYILYGTHNVTVGTTPLNAGVDPLPNQSIYIQIEE